MGMISLKRFKLYGTLPALVFLTAFFIAMSVRPESAICASNQNPENREVKPTSDRFLTLWDERNKYIVLGSFNEADSRIDNIVLERLRRGFTNLPIYSAALVKESLEQMKENKKEQAYNSIAQAQDLAPDFFESYVIEARNFLADGRISDAAGELYIGMRKKYSTFNTSFPAIFNVIAVTMCAYYWLILVFAAFILVRYAKLAAHDIQERIAGFDKHTAMIMTAVLALFPAAFIPNEVLYALILILLFWVYMNLRERLIAAALTALLFLLPFPFRFMGNGLAAMNEPTFRAVLKIRESTWGEKEIKALSEAMQSGAATSYEKENIISSQAKALEYTGQFEKAVSLLNGFRSDNNEMTGMVNVLKGNIYYRWEKYVEALKCYEEAARLLPDEPIAHFNLATVLSRPEIVSASADNVDRADKEIQRVKELNPQILNTWNRYQGLDPGRFVVEMPLPVTCIWRDFLTSTAGRAEVANNTFRRFSGGLSLNTAPYFAFTLLLLMGILTIAERFIPHAHSCRMCSKSFCPLCQSEIKDTTICSRCCNAFEMRAGLDPRIREQVRAEVRMKSHRAALSAEIMSLLLPGTGHLFLGKSVRGIIFSTVGILFFLGAAYRHGIARSEWLTPVQPSVILILLAAFLYIVFLGFVIWNIRREK